jgi:GH35 family endo-1,4-beta-xylanase
MEGIVVAASATIRGRGKRVLRRPWPAMAAVLVVSAFHSISAAAALSQHANLLIQPAIGTHHMTYNGGGHATARLLRHGGPGGTRAVEILVRRQPPDPWNIQYMVGVGPALRAGDQINLSFQFRSAARGKTVRLAAVLQYMRSPWTGIFSVSAATGFTWKTVHETITILKPIAPSNIAIAFNLGGQRQKLLLANIELTFQDHRRGNLNFHGPWLKPALARIAKYRMASLTVQVVNGQGHALADAKVHLEMLRHAFQFGTAVSSAMINSRSANGRKYRHTLLKYFNHVEVENGLKWGPWHDQRRRARTLRAVQWLAAHHLKIRGHNLIWPSWHWMPAFAVKLKTHPRQLRRAVEHHIFSEVRALRGKVDCWDVINEPLDNLSLQHLFGRSILTDCYQAAHRADPHAVLYVNEYEIAGAGGLHINKQNRYARLIHYLLAHGAELGGIGIESHYGSLLTPPRRLIRVLSRFARFGKPLTITELTIDVHNRQLQARYMRAFLIAAFSVPEVVGINQWGFWAGHDWISNTALWNGEWRLRPVGQAYIHLVYHTWWTNRTGQTNAHGAYHTRGFLGDYRLSVTAAGKTIHLRTRLEQGGRTVRVIVP